GLCGAALIGGAVFTSLDGEMTFAATPDKGDIALRGSVTGDQVGPVARKSDRLPPPSESNSARQVIRVSTAARSGRREIMRVSPFIRVAGNLSLSTSDLSAKVPPFNAQRLLADIGSASPVQAEDGADNAAEADAEVSFVTRDLAGVLPRAKIAATVPLEDVVMRVREASSWRGNEGVRYADASAQPGIQLYYAPEGKVDLYAGFE